MSAPTTEQQSHDEARLLPRLHEGGPGIVDDAELTRLAEQPAEPLLPVLDRSAAMWPLIVVFSLLPVTFATYYRTFDDATAAWGNRAVDVLAATTRLAWLFPGEGSLQFAAPLSSWTTAFVLSTAPRPWPSAVVYVSAAATAATGFGVYVAFRRLAGARFALWTTLLVCCHPLVLASATTPSPRALGCCLQVAAFGCLLRHGLTGGRVVGGWNVAAGALLGLTWLASGPFFVVGVTTTVLYAVLRTAFGRPPESVSVRRPFLRSLGAVAVVVGVAVLVGGWWSVVAAVEFGGPVWAGWFQLVEDVGVDPRGPGDVLHALVDQVGWLAGFVLCGAWRCLQLIRHERNEPRRVAALLLAWAVTASAGCLFAVWCVPRLTDEAFLAGQATAVVPFVALAVVGIEAVRDRSVGPVGTTVVALTSVLVRCAVGLFDHSVPVPWWDGFAVGWFLPVALLVSVSALWGAWRAKRLSDHLVRPVVGGVVVAVVVGQLVTGIMLARRTNGDDPAVMAFHEGLAKHGDVERVFVVGDRALEPRIEFVCRAVWAPVDVVNVPNRDTAVAAVLESDPPLRRSVLVDAGDDDRPFDDRRGRFDVAVVSPRRLFAGRRLRAHVVTVRDPSGEATASTGP